MATLHSYDWRVAVRTATLAGAGFYAWANTPGSGIQAQPEWVKVAGSIAVALATLAYDRFACAVKEQRDDATSPYRVIS